MDYKLIIRKIQALLHDPPEKPIILGKIGHEGRAKELMRELGLLDEARIPDDVRTADHIASAADRIDLPKYERFIADFCGKPVIMHPLSGKEFDLKSLAQVNIQDVSSTVDRAVVHLSGKYKEDSEKLYLALWRELVELLKKSGEGSAKLGQLWELLPADTRIPDHSIWEHKRVTSAIAGALPKPAFLLFAIGPVQDFIATARKTQDLWAGSYLLSYLSWSAMKLVAEEFGPDSLIFPDLCGQPFADKWLIDKGLQIEKPKSEELSSPTLPNRFLAIVPEGSVKDIAERAKQAVKNTFKDACYTVKTKMAETLNISNSTQWDEIWQRQTEDFIETYWAALPIDNYTTFLTIYKSLMGLTSNTEFDNLLKEYQTKGFDPNIGTVYGQIYRLVEKTLGSRKTVRDFKQTDEPNHKCTLCGVREPVHPGTYNNQSCSDTSGALKNWWQEVVIPALPQIRKSERLCAVCITKRLSSKHYFSDTLNFDINDSFPSVSMIATASFKLRVIENMNNNNLAVKVGCFVDTIQALAGERASGIPVPMVIRACRDEISRKFARLEGDWLYKAVFDDVKTLLEENQDRLQETDLKKLIAVAKEKQQELFKTIKEIPDDRRIGNPSTYYAILLMDGDNMGKWLSGECAPGIKDVLHPIVKNTLENDSSWQGLLKQKRPLNPSLHLATSKALRDFSLRVAREIVEKDHLGKLVYAGGDDVLAFVNLRDLPEVMRKLRAYFSGSLVADDITNKIAIDFKEGKGFIPVDEDGDALNIGSGKQIKGFMLSMGTNATASMGVVIAHHNSNLSQVLDEVRKCEKEAKKKTGFPLKNCGNDNKVNEKNAFCISLAKRAGGTEQISAKWYYKEFHPVPDTESTIFETIPLLRQWADAFYKDWISPKMVYTFRTETKGLEYQDKDGKLVQLPSEAIRLELLRIAKRQWKKKNSQEARHSREGGNPAADNDSDNVQIVELVDGLMNLHKNGLTLDDIGKFLSLAAFLGREGNR